MDSIPLDFSSKILLGGRKLGSYASLSLTFSDISFLNIRFQLKLIMKFRAVTQ